ncbi:MAG: hypothetical protein KDB22_02675 [Planctomycetales bacterium]|nr:hypothetical protein [Planctomycetales bacterium]
MDDPVYAAKYAEGAKKSEPLKKLKQAIDARHVEGLSGSYLAGGTQWRDDYQAAFGGVEWGLESYLASYASSRVALAAFASHEDWYAGVDGGLRMQLPTRLTPFVGLGSFNGLSTARVDATQDGQDNDDDGFADEWGEKKTSFDGWLSTIYPEVGVHFWPVGQMRVTGYARYLITSDGRAADDWLAGAQLAVFQR